MTSDSEREREGEREREREREKKVGNWQDARNILKVWLLKAADF